MDASSNGTGAAVVIGALLGFIGVTFAITAVTLVRSSDWMSTIPRLLGRALAVVMLAAVAAPSTYGAAWLFWTAHQGRFAPYASTRQEARPGCQAGADGMGLRGSAWDRYVSDCVGRAVAAAAPND